MEASEQKLVDRTNEEIKKEVASSSCSQSFEGSSLTLHPAQEPIADDDWEGGTWGLFWPDLEEFEELKENPEKYVKKHYEDKTKASSHPPANLKADITSVETMTASAAEKKPVAVPTPVAAAPAAPSAPVILRPQKAEVLPQPVVVVPKIKEEVVVPCPEFDPINVENDNSKWSWMRSGDKSAGRARFSLSIYW